MSETVCVCGGGGGPGGANPPNNFMCVGGGPNVCCIFLQIARVPKTKLENLDLLKMMRWNHWKNMVDVNIWVTIVESLHWFWLRCKSYDCTVCSRKFHNIDHWIKKSWFESKQKTPSTYCSANFRASSWETVRLFFRSILLPQSRTTQRKKEKKNN